MKQLINWENQCRRTAFACLFAYNMSGEPYLGVHLNRFQTREQMDDPGYWLAGEPEEHMKLRHF
jgi:hypothetical protein